MKALLILFMGTSLFSDNGGPAMQVMPSMDACEAVQEALLSPDGWQAVVRSRDGEVSDLTSLRALNIIAASKCVLLKQ